MTDYYHDAHALGLARAAALATAEIAGWQIDPSANSLLHRRFADYLVLPQAWAMIGPYAGPSSQGIGNLARAETRNDILLVAVSPDQTVRYVIGRTNGREWQSGCRLWQSDGGDLWLAPELVDVQSYRVSPHGLKDRPSAPWSDTRERARGFARGSLLIANRMSTA